MQTGELILPPLHGKNGCLLAAVFFVQGGRRTTWFKPTQQPRVKTYLTVSSPVLEEVRLSGSGDIHFGSPIVSEGDCSLSGTAASLANINISGSGRLDVSRLVVGR